MTKDELKNQAEEYRNKNCERWELDGLSVDEIAIENYLAGAEPREKRIAELEATCNKWFEHLKNREEELLNELNNQNAEYNKQIAELEKENKWLEGCKSELAEHLGKANDKVAELEEKLNWSKQDYLEAECYEKSLKEKIEELEKENEKLKAKNKWYSEQVCYKECAEVWGNLTKAKEILKKFIETSNPIYFEEDRQKVKTQAEQFLKEIEK